VHALLERLPDADPAARPALAARLLDRLAPWADAAERDALRAEAEAAMAAPGAEAVFGPDALAEAAVSLALGPLRVSGRIDRLHIGPDAVLAVDFKTDATPPAEADAAPEPYLRQLAAYREALRRLHPRRAVTVALLWTALPRLDRPSDAVLDAALARALAEA
jgi:ATP-dependent helicase/nuclease subunit A